MSSSTSCGCSIRSTAGSSWLRQENKRRCFNCLHVVSRLGMSGSAKCKCCSCRRVRPANASGKAARKVLNCLPKQSM
ncbi:Os02g0826650 [Oryza sativa Japonica Group]|uniref:Os02g0826650 protein n=1 Tax=Oryza sativa subsp. japonica TaxID=39947 RepID=A0A0P0VRH2_ORYSJ|nr:hypothetical protein EE612_014609 [Oryza sativa]BAS81703.1 Os02g0826650 [Oryza sativa Japonica Group]